MEIEIEEKYLEKPWLKSQAMGCIPETLKPYPEMTYTGRYLDRNVKKYPNELALVYLDYEMTFKELKEHVDRFATALSAMGVKKGNIVATCLPTSIQFIISDMAIIEIGAIHLPLSILDSVDAYIDKFNRANYQTVICLHTNVKDRDVIDKIKEVQKKTGFKDIILTKAEDYSLNPPKHEEEEGVIWFTDLVKRYPPNPPKVDIDPKKDLALLMFTGGTTGRPKGIMMTHYESVVRTHAYLGSIIPQSLLSLGNGLLTIQIPLPMSHVYGHEFLEMMFSLGCTLLLQKDPRDTKEFVKLAKKYHPALTTSAPTQYLKLVSDGTLKDIGMIYGSGSMDLAKEIQTKVEKEAKGMVFNSHGFSETCGATLVATTADLVGSMVGGRETAFKLISILDKILNTPGVIPSLRSVLLLIGRQRIGVIINTLVSFASVYLLPPPGDKRREMAGTRSVGYPLVDMDLKVVDEDTGKKIPMERVVKEKLKGEMCIKCPHNIYGYWPDPGSGFDEEGYVHSGDVIEVDEAGRVYIVGRSKDMANVSGYKVYTEEIDTLLYNEYPGVHEVATIGVPDPERPGSERIKIFIAPLSEYRGKMKEEDVIEFLRKKVPPYAVPKSVEFMDELPKNVAEKIFKKQLREEEIEKMKREGLLK